MQNSTIPFNGSYLTGEALERSQDFTTNTLDVKSSTGIGATTSILNIIEHDVLAVFPLSGVIQAKENKTHLFKSTRQYFIYHNSHDRWQDVIDYFDIYGDASTNLIICTTAEQILYIREKQPILYKRLTNTRTFVDEVHLFTQEWRDSLATFINLLTTEWKASFKFSTATPTRHFKTIFGDSYDIKQLKREFEKDKQIAITRNIQDAWSYVFSEMNQNRKVVIFTNDLNHHTKEFMELSRINLTGEGLKLKLSAFGKGLDHFKDKIDTRFLNTFPLIFCSSKYLTGYDIEPDTDTSILILTNNKSESTSYSVEDIIQAYGRVRCNLVNALLCIQKTMQPPTMMEVESIKVTSEATYLLAQEQQKFIPKDDKFFKKNYKKLPLDKNGNASKLIAYSNYLDAESEYILYNEIESFLNSYGFKIIDLDLSILTPEDKFYIKEIQKDKKLILKSIGINRKIDNIIKGQEGQNLFKTIMKVAENPKTKKNRDGYNQELILMYCIAYFREYLPPELFKMIPYNKQTRIKGLCTEINNYLNTNFHDENIRDKIDIDNYYLNKRLNKDYECKANPKDIWEIIRVFRYCYHHLNLNYKHLKPDSKKTIDLFYWVNYYKIKNLEAAHIRAKVMDRMKDLTDKDIIRMNKNIDGNGYTLTDDKVKFQKIYLEQIKEANMYLMSRNQNIFVSSYRDGREYNPLTNISTVFRENLLYNYTSVDVVSANAQFTDVIIGSNVGLNVYQNLMDRFNITRSDAKVKYNATLNNNKKTENQAMNLYMNCGYDFKQASHLATLTAGSLKGSYFRMMANAEDRIINSYKKEYFKGIKCYRLHDSLIMEQKPYNLPLEHDGVKFSLDTF